MAANIDTTLIATSDPLDLCKGFALFPGLGTIRAGISSGDNASLVLGKSATILAIRGTFNFSYRALVGVCGPSYAIRFQVAGTADGDNLDLNVNDQSMQAGFFAGFTFELPIVAQLQYWEPDHWYTPWKGHWHTAGSINVTPKVDLIGALIFVLTKVLGAGTGLAAVGAIVPGLLGSWSFVGNAPTTFGENDGSMTANPVMSIPVNILPFIPDVGEVDAGLAEVGVTLATGPNFGLKVPVTAAIKEVTLDNSATYGEPYWDGEEVNLTLTSGTALDHDPTDISVTVSHTPQLSFTLGWFGSASLVKLFSISASINIDILGMLGLRIELGTYDNDLDNTNGHTWVSSCADCGAQGAAATEMEVLFEDPVQD